MSCPVDVRITLAAGNETKGLLMTPQLHDAIFAIAMTDEQKVGRLIELMRRGMANLVVDSEGTSLPQAANFVWHQTSVTN